MKEILVVCCFKKTSGYLFVDGEYIVALRKFSGQPDSPERRCIQFHELDLFRQCDLERLTNRETVSLRVISKSHIISIQPHPFESHIPTGHFSPINRLPILTAVDCNKRILIVG